MSEITYENVCEKLAEVLPELRQRYEASVKSWREDTDFVPGPHVLYGEVLNPYLVSLLEADAESLKLRSIFEFLETLANSKDERVVDLVGATVLEYLRFRQKWMLSAEKYMGPMLARIMKTISGWPLER